ALAMSTPTALPRESYLLVFGPGGSRRIPLPDSGRLPLMRDEHGNLVAGNDDGRAVAHVILDRNATRIAAVAEEPPVLVDGCPISADRSLSSGEEVVIGSNTLVLHRRPGSRPATEILDLPGFEIRLGQEVERAMRYGRALALLVLYTRSGPPNAFEKMRERLTRCVRFVDVVGAIGGGELAVLLPETGEAAMIPATRLLHSITEEAPDARAGLARFPIDASDPEALLAGARAAARGASVGEVASVRAGVGTLEVGGHRVVVADAAMRKVFDLVRSLAATDLPVLVVGETGTGKDVVATALHEWSPRKTGRLVSVNCAAMTETLLESELFGHERGAFTGAVAAKSGLLESAGRGTVFLDEIGEASSRTQAELLRVLETKMVRRVGAVGERTIEARIVAATNRDIEAEIAAGRFRRDLFYRLGAAQIVVPPLRDRPLDTALLIDLFFDSACERLGRRQRELAPVTRQRLLLHDWPGNVRELRNLMEYLAATAHEPVVGADLLPEHIGASVAPWLLGQSARDRGAPVSPSPTAPPERFHPLADEVAALERLRMEQALVAAEGVRNQAARLLEMPIRTFAAKMKRYGLDGMPSTRKRFRPDESGSKS
ncbi:MAG TPA: sigma 54-interacting transcriptional regulator, partial [Polyangia bacterium]|nr:sigma 54-interacting transcriptional regulator [Polyangia bacterium]